VQIEQPEQVLYLLIVGGRTDVHRQHTLAWLCARCGATLVEREIRLERPTAAEFLAAERAAVQSVNAESAARRCPSCGFEHPPAYGLDPAIDTPEEREARATW
jgi:hypothetical protein